MSHGRDAKPGGFCCAARTHLVTSDLICPLELAGRWVAELAVHSALEDLEVLVEPTAALEERGAHGRDVDHSDTRTRDFTVGETFGETLVCFAITTQPLIQRASGLFFMFIVVHTRVCRQSSWRFALSLKLYRPP